MRLLLTMIKHETNTFSPVPTTVGRFARGLGEPLTGEAALAAFRGTGSGLGGFIDAAEREAVDVACSVAGEAWPSGPVDDDAFDSMVDRLCDDLAGSRFDGLLLDLHGAMVTRSHQDGEAEIMRRVRAAAPGLPIGVAFDMHANLSAASFRGASVVAGYKTYPHLDRRQTGNRVAELLIRALRGRINPVMAFGRAPMLPHVMRQGTHVPPNRDLQALASRYSEEPPILAASLFLGFPHADVPEAGVSAVVVSDADEATAAAHCESLLAAAWAARHDFIYSPEPLAASMERAARLASDGPHVLLDHYDNAASGGTMDCTEVLRAILDHGLDDVAFFAIRDPAAARAAASAGVGATVTLAIGGLTPMPAMARQSAPLTVSGQVKTISAGEYRNKGPMSRGLRMDMGLSVVLDLGRVEVAVVSDHQEPNDENALLTLGIDPTQKRYVALKSRVHWRAGLGHIAREVVECAGTGVCTSDFGELRFRRLPNPTFPIHETLNDWRPSCEIVPR